MDTCFDYLKWRGDLPFAESPLNEIDLACLNMLVIPDFDGIIPGNDETIRLEEACERYFRTGRKAGSELGILEPTDSVSLIELIKTCERFADIRLSAYQKKYSTESTEQFGAVTCDLSTGERVIVYKSTDDTLIGWKEDFMMAVSDHLPSQTDSLAYLIAHAGDAEKIILTGHSKGGNLAAYAAIHAPYGLQDRILSVISFDGPGFNSPVVEQECCKRIKDRILTIVPQSSLVGMLLHTPGQRIAVLAEGNGFYAHVPFTWGVSRTSFLRVSKMFPTSQRLNRAFDASLKKLSKEDRIRFINDLFDLLTAGGANTLTELKSGDFGKIITALTQTPKSRVINDFVRMVFDEYITTTGIRNIRERHEKASGAAKDAVARRKKAYAERRETLHRELIEKKPDNFRSPAPS